MTLKTKKRKYEKPAMQVVELREHARLLAGSDPKGNLNVEYEEENW